MKKYLASIVVLMGLCGSQAVSGQIASTQVVAFKLGFQRWDGSTNPVLLSVESRIGERLTFQPEVAFGHRTHFQEAPAVRDNFQAGVQGRGYLLLRQGKYFSGLYAGLYAMHHRTHWLHGDPVVAVTRQHFNSGGLVLGFQQGFLTRMRVDAGLKVGYSGGTWQETHSDAGGLLSKSMYGGGLVGYLSIQLGYAF